MEEASVRQAPEDPTDRLLYHLRACAGQLMTATDAEPPETPSVCRNPSVGTRLSAWGGHRVRMGERLVGKL